MMNLPSRILVEMEHTGNAKRANFALACEQAEQEVKQKQKTPNRSMPT